MDAPLCALVLVVDTRDGRLRHVYVPGQRHAPVVEAVTEVPPTHPALQPAVAAVQAWWSGRGATDADPRLSTVGTPLQQAVWQALRAIPPGQTRTYGDVAAAVGRPRAVRAVAQAVARNPWLLLVPCHRVVGQDGTLTGFAAGLPLKQALLDWEGLPPG
ncbi:methylated-DNA--[protein]-cysteine S-methyltransferase [Ideonella sp. TBM-1]|uniref:methylated-DNA--[protein]-cysteine S-methyltransferase n=1 Tax=Ideonella livida TaxID=2707176 RepID=A0A7C9TKJ2_9BURK|nr:methylated-DNA--[protein]-cysteine S-methyltransferase [Ideonella livida]